MGRLTLLAPAKLNLRLLVGSLGEDGYHPVRTLMVALDGLADRVTAEVAEARAVACPGVEERSNLAWIAIDALEEEVGRPLPVRLSIDKAIPSEAGLGGGSSDAAAALVAVDRLHGLGLSEADLERVAARVGSDVPFFIRGGAQWGEGRGERLRPGRAPAFAAVLLRERAGLPTAAVYRAFDRLGPPAPAGEEAVPTDVGGLAGWVRNDLWPAALALRPGLGRDARALRAAGARAVVLCGSGSCVAGLFADTEAARTAARALPARGLRAVVTPSAAGVRIVG